MTEVWDAPPESDPAALAAIGPILRAGRLARHRVLDVVCPKEHRLAQVIRTPAGPVVVATVLCHGGVVDPDRAEVPSLRRSRARTVARFLDGTNETQCRCRVTVMGGLWVEKQIEAGVRRAVYPRYPAPS